MSVLLMPRDSLGKHMQVLDERAGQHSADVRAVIDARRGQTVIRIDKTDDLDDGVSETSHHLRLGSERPVDVDVNDLACVDVVLIAYGGHHVASRFAAGDADELYGQAVDVVVIIGRHVPIGQHARHESDAAIILRGTDEDDVAVLQLDVVDGASHRVLVLLGFDGAVP